MSESEFFLLRAEQIESLVDVLDDAACNALVMKRLTDGTLVCVPPSTRDMRRWDIKPDGQWRRHNRETGEACRGSKFPVKIMRTAAVVGR
jgi:hypothetical protein